MFKLFVQTARVDARRMRHAADERQKSFSLRDVVIVEINNRTRATFEIPFH
jgi:hypothetical protein